MLGTMIQRQKSCNRKVASQNHPTRLYIPSSRPSNGLEKKSTRRGKHSRYPTSSPPSEVHHRLLEIQSKIAVANDNSESRNNEGSLSVPWGCYIHSSRAKSKWIIVCNGCYMGKKTCCSRLPFFFPHLLRYAFFVAGILGDCYYSRLLWTDSRLSAAMDSRLCAMLIHGSWMSLIWIPRATDRWSWLIRNFRGLFVRKSVFWFWVIWRQSSTFPPSD